MNKVIGLSEWIFTKEINADKRMTDVSIYLKSPSIKSILKFSAKERKDIIKLELKQNFKKLLDANFFDEYTIIGTKSRPIGIKTKIPYSLLGKLSKLPFLNTIFITKISHARKVKAKQATLHFYCVKMTVAIEIEGRKKGLQRIEDRMVLIKARSFDDAYGKIEENKKVM